MEDARTLKKPKKLLLKVKTTTSAKVIHMDDKIALTLWNRASLSDPDCVKMSIVV
jgi:hypothetical protein